MEWEQIVSDLIASEVVVSGSNDAGREQDRDLVPLPPLAASLLAIVGRSQSGKDLAAEYIANTYENVTLLTFSTPIIVEANILLSEDEQLKGLGHYITAENKTHLPYRQLLQWVGNRGREADPNYWNLEASASIAAARARGELVIFTGARSIKEITWLREQGATTWRILRPHNHYDTGSASIETELDSLPDRWFNAVLMNDIEGDLEHYLRQVRTAFKDLLVKPEA